MNKKPLNISEEAAVQMPMKDGCLADRAGGYWNLGIFWAARNTQQAQYTDRINAERFNRKTQSLESNGHVGQLGSLPADSEQYMMLEDLYKTTDRLNAHIESMALNKVNIEFFNKTNG